LAARRPLDGRLAASSQIGSLAGRSTLLMAAESGSDLLARSQSNVIGTPSFNMVMTGEVVITHLCGLKVNYNHVIRQVTAKS
jgi:hypothetical protein